MVATTPTTSQLYDLGPIARIPLGEGRTFQIDQLAVAVFHTRGGEVYATEASCPHGVAPLADGIIGARKVVCPLHACKFDLTTGQPVGNGCKPLKTYPVYINQMGAILLHLDERRE